MPRIDRLRDRGIRVPHVLGYGSVLESAPVAPTLDGLIMQVGQSNDGVGQGNSNNLDNGIYGGIGHLVTIAIPSDSRVQLSHHSAPAVADPLAWTDVPGVGTFRDLQQYAAPGSPGFGPELALGRYLADTGAMALPIHLAKFGVNGCDIGRFLPGSGFPVSGGELFTQLTAHINTCQTNSGKSLAVFIWGQGESDADSDAEAAAYQGKLTTFIAALRAIYGSTFLFVIRRLSNNQIGGFSNTMTAPRVAAVQAAQDAVAALDPSHCIVVNTDRAVTLASGPEHFKTDGYWQVGNELGAAILAAVNPAKSDNQGSGAVPYIQWIREPSNGSDTSTGDITIQAQTKLANGDRELLFGMHASSTSQNALPALTTANGFVQQGSAAQSIFSATTIVSLAAFLRTADGSQPLPAILTDLVVRKRGWTMAVRNTSGLDVAVVPTNLTINNVAATIQGLTTVTPNCLVLFVAAYFSGSPAAVSTFTAGGLTNVAIARNTFRNHNGSASQDACKFVVLSGTMATPGATGTAALTLASASVVAGLCLAFKP